MMEKVICVLSAFTNGASTLGSASNLDCIYFKK